MKRLKTLKAVRMVVRESVRYTRGEITYEQLRQVINEGRVMIGREPLGDGDDQG